MPERLSLVVANYFTHLASVEKEEKHRKYAKQFADYFAKNPDLDAKTILDLVQKKYPAEGPLDPKKGTTRKDLSSSTFYTQSILPLEQALRTPEDARTPSKTKPNRVDFIFDLMNEQTARTILHEGGLNFQGIKNRPAEEKVRLVGNLLGLSGKGYQGSSLQIAFDQFQTRLSNGGKIKLVCPGQFNDTKERNKAWQATRAGLDELIESGKRGDHFAILGKWADDDLTHAYSVQFIHDGKNLLCTLVNRGSRHLTDEKEAVPSTLTFLLPCETPADKAAAKEFRQDLTATLARQIEKGEKSKQAMSTFIKESKAQQIPTPKEMRLTEQKSGNCGFANANVTVRFYHAAQALKNNASLKLPQAFEKAKEPYKNIRKEDRIKAFLSLVSLARQFPHNHSYTEALQKAMIKIAEKESGSYKTLLEDCINRIVQHPDKEIISALLTQTAHSLQKTHPRACEKWKTSLQKTENPDFNRILANPSAMLSVSDESMKRIKEKVCQVFSLNASDFSQHLQAYKTIMKDYQGLVQKIGDLKHFPADSKETQFIQILYNPIQFLKHPEETKHALKSLSVEISTKQAKTTVASKGFKDRFLDLISPDNKTPQASPGRSPKSGL